MVIFAVGDVVSHIGCEFLREKLPAFKKVKGIDFCIANGENSAVGNGITPHSARYLFDSGVDFITTGNHALRKPEIFEYFDNERFILRPANFHRETPGRGYALVDMGFTEICVINLMGNVYMENCDNPFDTVDRILKKVPNKIKIVDFHAEATAEKIAMGRYLDGKVSAVFGTHTHVMTNDATVLPEGTGYITDLGMTGPVNSVLGVNIESATKRLRTGIPTRFTTAEGECMLNGCIFEIDNKTGKCLSVEPIILE